MKKREVSVKNWNYQWDIKPWPLYIHIYICMQNHKRRATQFFRKIYLSLYLKGLLKILLWEGWVGDRTELQHIDPHSYGLSVSFPFSWAAQPGSWGPRLSGCWFSLPYLISNWPDFLSSPGLYNCSSYTFLWASQIALIQPVHGLGYILIFLDRMHLIFTPVHFLFWQLGRGSICYRIRILWEIINSSFVVRRNDTYTAGADIKTITWL